MIFRWRLRAVAFSKPQRRHQDGLGRLLGQGGGAAELSAVEELVEDRLADADGIDARVVEEAGVLGGDERLDQLLGDPVIGHQAPALVVELADELVGARVDVGDQRRPVVLQAVERREARVVGVVPDDAPGPEEAQEPQGQEPAAAEDEQAALEAPPATGPRVLELEALAHALDLGVRSGGGRGGGRRVRCLGPGPGPGILGIFHGHPRGGGPSPALPGGTVRPRADRSLCRPSRAWGQEADRRVVP